MLLGEREAQGLLAAISAGEMRLVGAATLVETSAVILGRKGSPGEIALDALLQRLGIQVVEVSPEAAAFARSAYARFGKGVGSPGVLNFGDCLSYGVARALDEPLLCKGKDFPRTAIQSAAV